MDFNDIKKIMDDFNDSPTRELEITVDGFHIHLSKNEKSFNSQSSIPEKSSAIEPDNTNADLKVSEINEGLKLIKSPMVGMVYLQPEPNKPAYAPIGSKIHKGDIVCVIEAMKMMTEIKSEYTGIVTDVFIKNEELLEFDQPLFKIKEN